MHIKYNKMNLPQISIIVPIYKVEQYITNCIESILAQTFQNWELLLIDDGSPDKSGEICAGLIFAICKGIENMSSLR